MNTLEIVEDKKAGLEYSLSENRSILSDLEKAQYRYAIDVLGEVIDKAKEQETKQ